MFDHTSVADSARECFVWSREVSRNHNRVWWLAENEAALAHASNRLFVDTVDEIGAGGCRDGHVAKPPRRHQLGGFLARIEMRAYCGEGFTGRMSRGIRKFSAAT